MSAFIPQSGTSQEWKEAYDRLDEYLTAHSDISKLHRGQLILKILQAAAVKHASDPSQNPTRLVMAETYERLDRWFQQFFPDQEIPTSRIANHGRVAMHIIDAAARWPDLFLSEDEPPADFIETMKNTSVQSGPDLSISTMVVRPLDVQPIAELIEGGWNKISRLGLSLVLGSAAVSGVVLILRLGHS